MTFILKGFSGRKTEITKTNIRRNKKLASYDLIDSITNQVNQNSVIKQKRESNLDFARFILFIFLIISAKITVYIKTVAFIIYTTNHLYNNFS